MFRFFPEVEAVFLFGSRAEGRAGLESDLDLALVVREPTPGLKLRLLEALIRAGFDRVDLLFLNQADPVTRYEALRPKRMLFAREGFDRGGYYSRVLREYLTILERIRRYSLEEFLAEPERPPRLRRGLRTVPVRPNHPHT